MLRGLTTASSGMLTDQQLQQALANNLANLDTPAYKAIDGESLSFPQQLIEAMNSGDSSSGQPIGEMGTGAVYQEGVPYFAQGQLSDTGRNLDVAIEDNTPPGTYASVAGANNQTVSATGQIQAGGGGKLEINGQPLAVLNGQNQVIPNVYAVKNPQYQGTALYGADGKPNYDSAGNPSYVFENANGTVVGSPANPSDSDMAIRVGNQDDMGVHSFFPVDYTAYDGQKGIVLTQDGHFSVNSDHVLVDASGNPILPIGPNGQLIQGGRIEINPKYTGTNLFTSSGQPLTDSQGNPSFEVVNANGQPVAGGHLGTVGADVTNLSPLGQTEYMVNGTTNAQSVMAGLTTSNATLVPNELEESNVNQNATMTEMVQVLNEYQANQNVLQTEAQALNDAVTDVGKVNF